MGLSAELVEQFTLESKVAVITGAASGLGQESARVLAMAGATVMLADIDDGGLQVTAAMIAEAGGRAVVHCADVSRREDMDTLARTAVEQLGKLDIWVNCAGIPLVAPIVETDGEAAARTIAVNMMGTFWGCAAAARAMRDLDGGSIINISSGGGSNPVPGLAVYGMTKAAVEQLTRTSAWEFGAWGIRVNAIAPAWIETPMGTSLFRDEQGNIVTTLQETVRREQAAANPLNRNSTAMDIALAVLYLASGAGGFINGQVLQVNGGAHS